MPLSTETPGQKLERFLARAEMQQKELAAKLSVEPSYISRMVKDRVGWVHGRYFGQIASILRLTDEEIKELNPAAVITVAAPDSDPAPTPQRVLPPGLMDAVEEYGDTHPALRKPRVQEQLALVRHWDGGPKTARDWLDFYLDNRRRFTED